MKDSFIQVILETREILEDEGIEGLNARFDSLAIKDIAASCDRDLRAASVELECYLSNWSSGASLRAWYLRMANLIIPTIDPNGIAGSYYRKLQWWR